MTRTPNTTIASHWMSREERRLQEGVDLNILREAALTKESATMLGSYLFLC